MSQPHKLHYSACDVSEDIAVVRLHSREQDLIGSASEAHRSSFRPDIQGLRAIAILLVVGYHMRLPGFRGGFIGVDVFFVLSGYLITSILVNEMRHSGRIQLGRFYARRARRLLPAAVVTIFGTIALSSLLSPIEQFATSRTATATAAYVSNIWFMAKAADYFAPENEANPLLHTWSLGVEEQFYLIWPVIILAGLHGTTSRRRLLFFVTGLLAISFAGCIWLTHTHQPWAFFSSPTRAWQFGIGGLASLVSTVDRSWRTRALGWLGLVMTLGAAALISEKTMFPGTAAALPALGTAMILISGLCPGGWLRRGLSLGALQRLGQVSYSWYLWHWPVFATAAALWRSMPLWGRLLCALSSLGLATVTYVVVENPIRVNSYLVRRTRLSLALAGLLTLFAIAAAVFSSTSALRVMAASPQKEFAQAALDHTLAATSGCVTGFLDATPRECTFGISTSGHIVVLFGDSHAAQWFPAMEQIANQRGWRLVTFLKGSCPAARVHVFNPRLRQTESQCDTWRESVLQKIVALHPDLVVIANATGYVRGGARSDGYSQLSAEQWKTGMQSMLASLDKAGIATVLLRDTPRPGFNVPICLARAARHSWYSEKNCVLERSAVIDDNVQQAEITAATGLPHIGLLDLTDLFCNSETCPPLNNHVVVFRDSNHLTVQFARILAPVLSQRLRQEFVFW